MKRLNYETQGELSHDEATIRKLVTDLKLHCGGANAGLTLFLSSRYTG